MGLLLDQFIEAAREWHQRVPQPERESRQTSLVFYTMFWTGGSRVMLPLDARDERALTWEQKKELTVSDMRGYYSLEQVKAYLETLMRKSGLLEIFLIPSLVRALDYELQHAVDTYEENAAKRQRKIDELHEIDADPERRAVHLELLKRVHENMIADGYPDTPFDEDAAMAQDIEMFERLGGYDPAKKARYEVDVALWREVTHDLIALENLERATTEMLDEWRERQ